MYDEMLFTVDGKTAAKVARVDLADLDLQERAHLQEWILANPNVIGPGAAVITSEYDKWQTSAGAPVLDRLDILAIEPDGRLVIVELKRGIAPHTVHMQAINYAAMVSRLQPDDVAELYAATKAQAGEHIDPESALTKLRTEWLLSVEGIRRPRIVLIASDFPASVTASVVWLNEQQVDISLIRFRAYRLREQTVVSFNRLFPVPDVEEFTIGRRPDHPTVPHDSPGEQWDQDSLQRLLEQANPATLAMLDLCAVETPASVGVKDIAATAGISDGAVRGQLAGLTMRLKNSKYGFAQNTWPVYVTWLAGGVASYAMEPPLAAIWRTVRAGPTSMASTDMNLGTAEEAKTTMLPESPIDRT